MIEITRDAIAQAYDPEAFKYHSIEQRSSGAARWSARRHLALEAADRMLNSGVLDQLRVESVRALEEATTALFNVYVELGFDTDGETNALRFAARTKDFPGVVVECAKEHRREAEEEDLEIVRQVEDLKILVATLVPSGGKISVSREALLNVPRDVKLIFEYEVDQEFQSIHRIDPPNKN